jgi:hypothetical protein
MAGNIRPSGDGYLVGTFTTAEAINRGELVYLSDNDTVSKAAAISNPVIGVALEDAASGAACTVVRGYCLVAAGAAIAVAAGVSEIVVDSTARAIPVGTTNFATTSGFVVGQALADANAAGDLVPCYVYPVRSDKNYGA